MTVDPERESEREDFPWYCKENMGTLAALISDVGIIKERSNHQGDAQKELGRDMKVISDNLALLKEKVEGPIFSSKKQAGAFAAAVVIIAQILSQILPLFG